MIAVQQSNQIDLARLLDELEGLSGNKDTVRAMLTTSTKGVLAWVREQTDQPGRTVIVCSSVLYDGVYKRTTEPLPLRLFVDAIKRINPEAWVFVYTNLPFERIIRDADVEGIIHKWPDRHFKGIIEFLQLPFDEMTIEDTRKKMRQMSGTGTLR